MCITFFYINPDKNGKFKLVLVMNRDEFHKRPTSISSWENDVLAGRDQEPGREGGTWLGINKSGFVGLLTNIYTGKQSPGAGRGFLVIDYLEGNQDPQEYLRCLSMNKALYSPFNLVLFKPDGDTYEGQYYCRGHPGCVVDQSVGPMDLERGCHGLSNHPISCPYRKTIAGNEKFQQIILDHLNNREKLIEAAFDMMTDNTSHHPDDQMIKQGGPESPMASYHEKLACVNVTISEKGYGTRVTTLILVDRDNQVTFIERQLQTGQETVHEFSF